MDWKAFSLLLALFGLILAETQPPTGSVSPKSSHPTGTPIADPTISTHAPSPIAQSQSTSCQCCGSKTVTVAAELDAVMDCRDFTGNLVIRDITLSVSDDLELQLSSIRGSLEISNVGKEDGSAYSIKMDSLSVADNMTFSGLNGVNMPSLPKLTTATSVTFKDVLFDGQSQFESTSGSLVDLQAIEYLTFESTNILGVGPLGMGYSIGGGPSPSITVLNNSKLTVINLSENSTSTTNISIEGNQALQTIILAAGAIDSLTITNNNDLANVSLSKLTTANGAMNIEGNANLSSLTLSSLSTLSGPLSISDNPKLTSIDMLDLSTINSNFTVAGPINALTLNPTTVTGQIDVTVDSGGSFNCSSIDQISQTSGTPVCTHAPSAATASLVSPSPSSTGSAPSSPTHSQGGKGKGRLSSSASIGIGVGVGIGGALLLGIALCLCCRGRKKNSGNQRSAPSRTYSRPGKGYDGSGDHLSYREVPYESGGGAGVVGGVDRGVKPEPQSEEHTPSSAVGMKDAWTAPGPARTTAQKEAEPEEQQGVRHEMDARSIDFQDDDEEAETRSLEDIERVHRQQ